MIEPAAGVPNVVTRSSEVYVRGYAMTFVALPDPAHEQVRVVEKTGTVDIRSIDGWEMESMRRKDHSGLLTGLRLRR